jgi:hypothetical protein
MVMNKSLQNFEESIMSIEDRGCIAEQIKFQSKFYHIQYTFLL